MTHTVRPIQTSGEYAFSGPLFRPYVRQICSMICNYFWRTHQKTVIQQKREEIDIESNTNKYIAFDKYFSPTNPMFYTLFHLLWLSIAAVLPVLPFLSVSLSPVSSRMSCITFSPETRFRIFSLLLC